MDNLKRYQICHHLITYFATLIFPKKSYLGLIFRNGGSIIFAFPFSSKLPNLSLPNQDEQCLRVCLVVRKKVKNGKGKR